MFKTKYLDYQRKKLIDIPLNPYELTASGLKKLRRNIIFSLTSLVLSSALFISIFRMIMLYKSDKASISAGLWLCGLIVLAALMIYTSRVFDKSTKSMLETGLWWRISVDDELQDEWEIAQKHKSQSAAFEYALVLFGIGLVLWAITCAISYITINKLPPLPPMDITIAVLFCMFFAFSLFPLIHLAWNLEAISDADAIESIPVKTDKASPLNQSQIWKKRLVTASPYIIGLVIGVWVVSSNNGGIFYDIGYDFGHWLGSVFKN